MNIIKRAISVKLREREVKKAIKEYNTALQTMAKAARRLLNVSRKTGTETPRLTAAVLQIEKLAECALIKKTDLKGGGTNVEQGQRPCRCCEDSGNSGV